jgi:hypothetical protein
MRKFLATPLLALLLTACATDMKPHQEALIGIGVQYATAKFINTDAERAERVATAVEHAINLVNGDVVASIAALEEEVREHVDFTRMKPEDALLVNALIGAVRIELEQRLGGKEIAAEHKVEIAKVLGWVQAAARMFVAGR